MHASKENAAKTLHYIKGGLKADTAEFAFACRFLEAARRKLPGEAAYAKDKKRCKTATAK